MAMSGPNQDRSGLEAKLALMMAESTVDTRTFEVGRDEQPPRSSSGKGRHRGRAGLPECARKERDAGQALRHQDSHPWNVIAMGVADERV
jgi:hypothetical protein